MIRLLYNPFLMSLVTDENMVLVRLLCNRFASNSRFCDITSTVNSKITKHLI